MPRRRKTALGLGLVAAAGSVSWWATGLLDGPWGMLPGGRFDGPGVPCAAADWEAFSAVPEVEVEVWPASPRSVKTWSVVHGGQLYLPADFLTPWKRWPYQVMEDDRLRLRFDGRIFGGYWFGGSRFRLGFRGLLFGLGGGRLFGGATKGYEARDHRDDVDPFLTHRLSSESAYSLLSRRFQRLLGSPRAPT